MKAPIKVECPYCGALVRGLTDSATAYGRAREIISCGGSEEPGCGEEFVVDVRVEIHSKAFKIVDPTKEEK